MQISHVIIRRLPLLKSTYSTTEIDVFQGLQLAFSTPKFKTSISIYLFLFINISTKPIK